MLQQTDLHITWFILGYLDGPFHQIEQSQSSLCFDVPVDKFSEFDLDLIVPLK